MSTTPDLWRGDVTVVGKTEAALKLEHEGDEQYIPRSEIDNSSEIDAWNAAEGDEGELAIPQWIAEDRGWG